MAWTFTPADGFTGTAVINYTLTDQDGATASSTHDVVVAAPPKPIAINDSYTIGYGATLNGDVKPTIRHRPGRPSRPCRSLQPVR